jgi:hypothetical protein
VITTLPHRCDKDNPILLGPLSRFSGKSGGSH